MPGQSLTFFNQTFLVAARLDRTGMGFDTSVFMNLSTAKKLAQESERIQAHPVAENTNLISSVMVKVEDSYEVKAVANKILQAYAIEGVDVILSKNIISDISGSLQGLSQYIYTLAVVLWMLAVGVLIIVFSVILNERKREFSIFQALGASRGKLVKLILCEASLVSFSGAAAGTIAAAGIVFPFSIYISSLLKLPYLQPAYGSILMIGLMSFLVALAAGPLALVYAAVKMGKSEIYTAIRERE